MSNDPHGENWTSWFLSFLKRPRVQFAIVIGSIIVGTLGVIDFALSYRIWRVVSTENRVLLWCPSEVSERSAIVFGSWEGGKPDDLIRLYVAPEDGSNKYWLQDPQPERDNLFSYSILLGNYCGFGHEKPDWPIRYHVYAFLLPRSVRDSLPGSSKEQGPFAVSANPTHLIAQLKGLGARTYAECTIDRLEPCAMPVIRMLEDQSTMCSLPIIRGRSVELFWDGAGKDKVLELEIWSKEGHQISAGRKVESGDKIDIGQPGVYEIKLFRPGVRRCEIDLWVELESEM